MSTDASPPAAPVLEMREVTVAARRDPAAAVAEAVNWTVRRGEFWVVGAPQHSGKSDFLLFAGGMAAPARGEYYFLGERMPIFEEARLAHRLKLGFVFDGGQLLGQLTIAENIALPLQYHRDLAFGETAARVEAALELAGLTPWADRRPEQLGRSWRQRAGLARSLMLQPEVLLLDSPLTGLDVRHTFWWLGLLDQLARGHPFLDHRPLTLVVTADDLRPWRRHANRVACLAGRRLRVLGDWAAAERCEEATLRELLAEEDGRTTGAP
jgi:ABC-type transporter Mla maintaining outer membrane lipid asymmetry ATPase subunit MlaF